jgi:SAM-dependent methyltransferase
MGEAKRRKQNLTTEPHPKEIEALSALIRQGRFQEAESAARMMTERFPLDGFGWKALGVVLKQQGHKNEALAAMQKAAELLPLDSETHFNVGLLQKEIGLLKEAAASFRHTAEIAPDFADARISLGNTLHQIVGEDSGAAFFGESKHEAEAVRQQYENLPFPSRDPEGERYVLRVSLPDTLAKINQYCFGGTRDFSKPFRVLVAGCGTGDSPIWLAWQLRNTPAEVVAVDLSQTSLEVAQARAKVRNLTNIKWVHGSLLDVASMDLGKFDYITSLGVLHHLPDPVAGLAALESVLADNGAMAIMLYGAVGREQIYAMQRVLRQLTVGIDNPGRKLAFAKQVLANLPATNGFRIREGLEAIRSQYLQDDTNFWDTLLHSQDRAYTASQVRDYLASAGLQLQAYASYQGVDAITRLQYDLNLYIQDAQDRERLAALPVGEREDLAEALDGSLPLHTVYATRTAGSSLDVSAGNAILAPMSRRAQQILAYLSQTDQGIDISLRNGMTLPYNPSPVTRAFLARVDGNRDNAEITRSLGIENNADALRLLHQELDIPSALHWMVARTAAGSRVEPLQDRTVLSSPLRNFEPTSLPL